jgi:hypothetical protein
MLQASSLQDTNKALVQASFDRWARGTGSPFELIHPFNVRTRTPLVPTNHRAALEYRNVLFPRLQNVRQTCHAIG